MMDMFATCSKRRIIEKIEGDKVQNITQKTVMKKGATTTKKPHNKNVKEEDENSSSKN